MADISDLERLKALAAINLLKARRDRAADTKDWALYESLHAPDHHSYNGDYPPTRTAAEMMVMVRRSMAPLTTLHHSHNPEIVFETASRARGSWPMKGYSFWSQNGEEHRFLALGHYQETYEERGGEWLFTSRRVEYAHTERTPGAIFPPRIDHDGNDESDAL